MAEDLREILGKKSPYDRLVVGQITEVSPTTGTVQVEFADISGQRSMRVTHPYVSANSWIRTMPEPGTYCLIGFRASTIGHAEIISYIEPDEGSRVYHGENEDQIRTGRTSPSAGKHAYRPLQSGEFELMSYGKASVFGSRRGTLELRGGSVFCIMSNDFLEIADRAPTHKRQMLAHRYDGLGDEERLGAVKRPKSGDQAAGWETLIQEGGEFAREHFISLLFEGTPGSLYDKRTGHVYDNTGGKVNHPDSGKWLRHKELWYTSSESVVGYFIDENGNVTLSLPEDAQVGLHFNLPGAMSSEKHDIGKDYVKYVGQNSQIHIINRYDMVVGSDYSSQILGSETRNVSGSQEITIGGDMAENVGGTKQLIIGGDFEIVVQGQLKINVAGNTKLITGGEATLLSSSLKIVKGSPTAIN